MHKIPLSAKKISLLAAYWLFPSLPWCWAKSYFRTLDCLWVSVLQLSFWPLQTPPTFHPPMHTQVLLFHFEWIDSIVKHGIWAAHLQIIDLVLADFFFSLSKLGSGFIFVSSVVNILGLFLSEDFSGELKHSFKFLWV